jgi:hypothetical protein
MGLIIFLRKERRTLDRLHSTRGNERLVWQVFYAKNGILCLFLINYVCRQGIFVTMTIYPRCVVIIILILCLITYISGGGFFLGQRNFIVLKSYYV